MLKPIIELKNLKVAASLSEETTAYTATVYVDGVKFCEASNHGQGAEDHFYPAAGKTYADLAALEERIKATYPKFNLAYSDDEPENLIDMDLSLVIGGLIADAGWIKDYRRTIKTKVLFLKPGEKAVFQMKLQTPHPLEKHVAAILAKTPGAVILNTLPEAEGLALYKANVGQR